MLNLLKTLLYLGAMAVLFSLFIFVFLPISVFLGVKRGTFFESVFRL